MTTVAVLRHSALYCVILASVLSPLSAGAQGDNAKLPEFEVATVKPVDMSPGVSHIFGTNVTPSGRVKITSFPLKLLICAAFGVQFWQLSGGDDWVGKQLYDIEGVPPQTDPPTVYNIRHSNQGIEDPRLKKMLQALLIERFGLKYHMGTKPGTVYLLEKSGKPSPLVASKEAGAKMFGEGFSGDVGFGGNRWGIYNTSMPQLAAYASGLMEKAVVDRTGLDGAFDFRWTVPDANEKASSDEAMNNYYQTFPLFLNAMGLKLTKTTGDVQMFVIDHADAPSAN